MARQRSSKSNRMESQVRSGAARVAFEALIDYAGLFPPAKLDMRPALEEYAQARRGPFAWMLGRFIVPASRLDECIGALAARQEALALSVILDAGENPRDWFGELHRLLDGLAELRQTQPRVSIESLEVPLPPLATQRETYDAAIGQYAASVGRSGFGGVPSFVELARDARWLESLTGAMFALARHRLGAKVRCGGVVPEAVPSEAELAAFLRASASERVRFKATAGLHHPVRHFNAEAGLEMHGFLNVLAASALALRGDGDLEGVLGDRDAADFGFDAEALRWNGERFGVEELRAVRETGFVAFGSCSFAEPVEDLRAMGLPA